MRDLIPGVGAGGSGHLPCKSGYGRVKRVQFSESICDYQRRIKSALQL